MPPPSRAPCKPENSVSMIRDDLFDLELATSYGKSAKKGSKSIRKKIKHLDHMKIANKSDASEWSSSDTKQTPFNLVSTALYQERNRSKEESEQTREDQNSSDHSASKASAGNSLIRLRPVTQESSRSLSPTLAWLSTKEKMIRNQSKKMVLRSPKNNTMTVGKKQNSKVGEQKKNEVYSLDQHPLLVPTTSQTTANTSLRSLETFLTSTAMLPQTVDRNVSLSMSHDEESDDEVNMKTSCERNGYVRLNAKKSTVGRKRKAESQKISSGLLSDNFLRRFVSQTNLDTGNKTITNTEKPGDLRHQPQKDFQTCGTSCQSRRTTRSREFTKDQGEIMDETKPKTKITTVKEEFDETLSKRSARSKQSTRSIHSLFKWRKGQPRDAEKEDLKTLRSKCSIRTMQSPKTKASQFSIGFFSKKKQPKNRGGKRQRRQNAKTKIISVSAVKEILSRRSAIRTYSPTAINDPGKNAIWYRGRSYAEATMERSKKETRQELSKVSDAKLKKWLAFAHEGIKRAVANDQLDCGSSISSASNSFLDDHEDDDLLRLEKDDAVQIMLDEEDDIEPTFAFDRDGDGKSAFVDKCHDSFGCDEGEGNKSIRSASSFEVMYNCVTCSVLAYDPARHCTKDSYYTQGYLQGALQHLSGPWEKAESKKTC